MRDARNTAFATLALLAALAAACGGKALASVGGEVIGEGDVIAAAGYLPKGEKLREVVDGLVERKIILSLASFVVSGHRSFSLVTHRACPLTIVGSASSSPRRASESKLAAIVVSSRGPRGGFTGML